MNPVGLFGIPVLNWYRLLRHLKQYYTALGWDPYFFFFTLPCDVTALYFELRRASRSKLLSEQRGATERDKGEKERMAAAATSTTPQLVDKPGAQSAIWSYFGFKTNEHGEAINTETFPTWQNT